MNRKFLIEQIICKIYIEGIFRENYSKEIAEHILSKCVGAPVLINILNENEEIIKRKLPKIAYT